VAGWSLGGCGYAHAGRVAGKRFNEYDEETEFGFRVRLEKLLAEGLRQVRIKRVSKDLDVVEILSEEFRKVMKEAKRLRYPYDHIRILVYIATRVLGDPSEIKIVRVGHSTLHERILLNS
jgi:hypothetical protein